MKTVKFALIAVIVACTMVGMANTDGIKSNPKKAVNMTIDEALKVPGMSQAIHQQVDPGFLNKIEQLYIIEVTHKNVVYRILGSRQSWIKFFRGPIPKLYGKAKAKGPGESIE